MRTLLLTTVGAALFSLPAFAADPCEPLRVRDSVPLANASAEDKALAAVLTRTAQACADANSTACDAAKVECSTQMAATLKSQAAFDEGAWLRDMLLPYQGQNYPMTRQFAAGQGATDRSCAVDAVTLNAASQRRLQQASRRDALVAEYTLYAKWAQDTASRCQTNAAAEQVRAEKAKAEAEAAAVIAGAEAAKQKLALDQKKAAEEAAKKAEADRLAAEAAKKKAAEEAAKKQAEDAKKAAEDAKKQAEADRKKAAEAEEKARKERAETEEKARQERADAEEKARKEREAAAKAAADAKIVAEREGKKTAAKEQQAALLAQADAELKAAEADVEKRKKEAAAQAELDAARRLEEAKKRKAALEKKAEDVKIPTDDERSKGAVSLAIGAGYGGFGLAAGPYAGPVFGAQLQFHLGFWGVAPADGMASGFELRLLGRYLDTFNTASALSAASGLVTGRYFIGRFGFGAAFDARFTQTSVASTDFGLGPSLSLAIVDSPKNRVNLNVHWLGILNPNLGHFSADFEMSFSYFTFGISGGDVASVAPGQNGYQVSGFVGGRLPW